MSGVSMALLSGSTTARKGQGPDGAWRGDLLMVSAALCMALYSIWSKSLIRRSEPIAFTTLAMAGGAAGATMTARVKNGHVGHSTGAPGVPQITDDIGAPGRWAELGQLRKWSKAQGSEPKPGSHAIEFRVRLNAIRREFMMALGATSPQGFLSYGLVSSSSAGLRGSVYLYGAQRRLPEFSNQVLTRA